MKLKETKRDPAHVFGTCVGCLAISACISWGPTALVMPLSQRASFGGLLLQRHLDSGGWSGLSATERLDVGFMWGRAILGASLYVYSAVASLALLRKGKFFRVASIVVLCFVVGLAVVAWVFRATPFQTRYG